MKPAVRILVISALADKATAVEAMEKGANGFLNKPFTDRQLNEAIAELMRSAEMLQEQELKTFVEGTTNYFEVAAQQPASIGSPYLVTKGKPGVHDYTGVINITGKREGVVYFTAPRAMLTVLLMKMQETRLQPRDHEGSGWRGRQHDLGQRAPGFRPGLRDLGAERDGGRTPSRLPARTCARS